MGLKVSEGGVWSYEPDEDTPKGVWIVWASYSRTDGFHAIYPADQELDALRYINEHGYGRVEFHEFGEIR
jgi:hypothetical protein